MTQMSSDNRTPQPPAGHGHAQPEKRTEVRCPATDIPVLRVDGGLVVGEMSHEEAESYLALREAAAAGNTDAQLILKLMRTQERLTHSPALRAQLQQTIDMLQTRLRGPE